MPKVEVYNVEGKKVSDIDLKEEIFGIKPNEGLVHDVLMNYLANQRQGTQSTKTRSEVRGGGRKPWRQKGTGRARQGSIRSVQWVGGGNYGTPVPRDYSKKQNRKERGLAIKSALAEKASSQRYVLLYYSLFSFAILYPTPLIVSIISAPAFLRIFLIWVSISRSSPIKS